MQQNLLELYKRYVPRMFMGHSMQINSSKFLYLLFGIYKKNVPRMFVTFKLHSESLQSVVLDAGQIMYPLFV